jgi:protein SCO1/2
MNQERMLKIAAGLCGALLIVSGAWVFSRPKPVDLPSYFSAPDFTLTSQNGELFDSSRLKGKVWVAAFVYSTCKTSCPMLGAQMHRLYASMPNGGDFALVSITVDPAKDTPEVLAKYAKDLGVQDDRWVFLTGKAAYIKQIVTDGFKLAAEPGQPSASGDIMHSSKLVLVDAKGMIRGYFDGTLHQSADEIKRAAAQLIDDAKRS